MSSLCNHAMKRRCNTRMTSHSIFPKTKDVGETATMMEISHTSSNIFSLASSHQLPRPSRPPGKARGTTQAIRNQRGAVWSRTPPLSGRSVEEGARGGAEAESSQTRQQVWIRQVRQQEITLTELHADANISKTLDSGNTPLVTGRQELEPFLVVLCGRSPKIPAHEDRISTQTDHDEETPRRYDAHLLRVPKKCKNHMRHRRDTHVRLWKALYTKTTPMHPAHLPTSAYNTSWTAKDQRSVPSGHTRTSKPSISSTGSCNSAPLCPTHVLSSDPRTFNDHSLGYVRVAQEATHQLERGRLERGDQFAITNTEKRINEHFRRDVVTTWSFTRLDVTFQKKNDDYTATKHCPTPTTLRCVPSVHLEQESVHSSVEGMSSHLFSVR